MADNVVSLMVSQINKLPTRTRNILKSAAAIGNQFDSEILALISEQDRKTALNNLWKAIEQGLVLPLDDHYRYSEETEKNQEKAMFVFRHDRIQQAAYSLIPDAEKPSLHLEIGQLLFANIPHENREDRIFEIVNQWNEGRGLTERQSERDELAGLNLLAGHKAKASTAYQAAFGYLRIGIELLSENSWESNYDLTMALYETASEAAYLSGDFNEMERLSEIILQKAETLLNRVKAYEVRIQAYIAQNRLTEATGIGLQVLKLFDVEIPEKSTRADVILRVEKLKADMSGTQIEDLLYLPEVTDPTYLTVGRILANVAAVFYFINPELYSLTAIAHVAISVKHGNASYSTYAYASYGRTLCILGDIETGYQFGQLALKLLERFESKELRTKVIFMVNYFVNHWKEHGRETILNLLEAYRSGVETGDLEYAGYSANTYVWHQYFIGRELNMVELEMATYGAAISQLRQAHSLQRSRIHRQAVLNLLGRAANPCRLIGECYDETSVPQSGTSAVTMFHIAFNKFVLCCYFGNYKEALEHAEIVGKYIGGIGALNVPMFHFYDSLVRLAGYKDAGPDEQARISEKVSDNQEKMKKWAHHCPMNNLHKWYLVEAERARVSGNEGDARIFYDKAIALAQENEYLNEEALSCELAGHYYLEIKIPHTARYYLQDAYHAYQRWGAEAKVRELGEKFPFLLSAGKAAQITDRTITKSGTVIKSFLDTDSILKASQTLSSEIELGYLLEKIMNIVIENAGAEKGVFIETENNRMIIQAEAEVGKVFNILKAVPAEEYGNLPFSIIRYVARTRQHLVSDKISQDPAYLSDPYIQKHRTKSVICFPILNKGNLTGIIYLENNLTIGAFTQNRLQILNLLSGQAAISLENAKLVNHLREKERLKRDMELARQIQTVLLPKKPEISGYDIAASCEPAEEVGGDYYDVISVGGFDWIVIGDVSGHGVTAGLVMMMVQTAIHTVLIANPQVAPSQLLRIINRTIYENIARMDEQKHMTIVVLACGKDGHFCFSGLHEDMLIRRTDTGKIENIRTDGMWIGIEADISGLLSDSTLKLESGDCMVLYTDGITEAWGQGIGLFGTERLIKVIESCGDKSVSEIHAAVLQALKPYEKPDDVTLFVMKRV